MDQYKSKFTGAQIDNAVEHQYKVTQLVKNQLLLPSNSTAIATCPSDTKEIVVNFRNTSTSMETYDVCSCRFMTNDNSSVTGFVYTGSFTTDASASAINTYLGQAYLQLRRVPIPELHDELYFIKNTDFGEGYGQVAITDVWAITY